MHDYFTHVKCITVSAAFMFIWTAYTQEEYRDRNIMDVCAFMFKGCDKLNNWPITPTFTRNLIKERCESARSFSLWHVCVTEIYPYAMTSRCTLLLVIHVRYDSSTCDIKFLRPNYSPCIKQSTQSFKILKGRFYHETAYFHSLEYTTRRGWPD